MVSKTLHQHEPECIHVYVAADIYSYIYSTLVIRKHRDQMEILVAITDFKK